MHWAVVIDYICPGGCQLALHGDRLYLYSGHTVTVDKEDRSESDTVHDDLWSLDLNTFMVRQPSHIAADHFSICTVATPGLQALQGKGIRLQLRCAAMLPETCRCVNAA